MKSLDDYNEFTNHLDNVSRNPDGSAVACCPAHEDRNPSLSMTPANDRLLVCCHAKCSLEDIASSVGLSVSYFFDGDHGRHRYTSHFSGPGESVSHITKPTAATSDHLMPDIGPTQPKPQPMSESLIGDRGKLGKPSEEYHYCTKPGQEYPSLIVGRFYPVDSVWDIEKQKWTKTIRPFYLVEGSDPPQYKTGRGNIAPPLYGLPELMESDPSEPVYIVEGEGKVNDLIRLGFIAVSLIGGSNSPWHDQYTKSLKGRDVVILPDHDEPGEKWTQKIAEALRGSVASVKLVEWDELPVGHDVQDWLLRFPANERQAALSRLVSGAVDWKDEPTPSRELSLLDPGPLPDELLHVPGFVEMVMQYTLSTAPYPNRVLAFCGALTMQAFLAGRTIRDEGNIRTNLFMIALADSGAGKNHPREVNIEIAKAAGLLDCLGDRFASGEGLEDAMHETPNMLFQTDEIDAMLKSLSGGRDGRPSSIMDTMLRLQSMAKSTYSMRRLARKQGKDDTQTGRMIVNPCLNLFGTAIPEYYYSALSEQQLTNGFLSRMVVLESGPRGRSNRDRKVIDIPSEIVNIAESWSKPRLSEVEWSTGQIEGYAAGNLIEYTDNTRDRDPNIQVVKMEPVARNYMMELQDEIDDRIDELRKAGDSVSATVWTRTYEGIARLSLIYAASADYQNPMITIDAVKWAAAFMYHRTRATIFRAKTIVSDGSFGSMCLKVTATIRANNGQMTRSELLRKHRNLNARDLDSILDTLEQRDEIVIDEKRNRRGRNASIYRLQP